MANTHSATVAAASNQWFSAADSASLSITGDLTLECWVKIASAPGDYDLITKTDVNTQRSWRFTYTSPTQLRFNTSDTGSNNIGGGVTYDLGTATWHHVAVVYTASTGNAEFFVDGTSQGSASGFHTSLFDGTARVGIGGRDDGTGTANAQIDEVRIWNVARTGTQINTNKAVSIDSATNLQGSWHLNNALTDSSGNSNTLTNNGSATFTTDIPYTDATVATTTATKHALLMLGVG